MLTAADGVAATLWLSLTAYVLLGGADFGAGIWELFATGPRAAAQRAAIARHLGPVWEANHVWLILMITGLFTGFAMAFGVLATALFVPFTAALVGIVLRGAAFVFRAEAPEPAAAGLWGRVFAASSLIAPAFLAASAAAVAAGAIRAPGGRYAGGAFTGWTTPLALDLALFAVALCAYLAATYLGVETRGQRGLQEDFRARALLAGGAAGVFGLAGLALARAEAPVLWAALSGRGLPLTVLALLVGAAAPAAIWTGRHRLARLLVVAQVSFVLWAWAVGQWPELVPPDLSIQGSAAMAGTEVTLLVVVVAGMAFLAPSLWLLFRVFRSRSAPS